MQTIELQLKQHSYPIYIGNDLLRNDELFHRHIHGTQILIVSNETIAPLYLSFLRDMASKYQCDVVLLPDGEKYKTLQTFQKILDALIEKGHQRSTTLIALGGGVIGDMTGFAAACYQRGVHFIQVPTTLLAQVDAAIGGKTAVNHPLGKNMIGAFHQPQAVFCDLNTLLSLPVREYRAGLAEVVKYGLLADAQLFAYLEKNSEAINQLDADVLLHIIHRCASIKADIVSADEKESHCRALLNLGHTFAHAIESVSHYATWLHGEAVAMGLVCAAQLSAQLHLIKKSDVDRIKTLLKKFALPCSWPTAISIDDGMLAMARDKKVINSKLRFILLDAIGHAFIADDITNEDVISTLQAVATNE